MPLSDAASFDQSGGPCSVVDVEVPPLGVVRELELEHPAAAAPASTPDPSTVAPRRNVRRSIRSERPPSPPPPLSTFGHGGRG